MDLNKIKKVHFVGIGGIGISAIARLMQINGKKVTGSDRSKLPITDALIKEGIKIYFKQEAKNIKRNTDLIVYTIAVDDKNPEIKQSDKLGIPKLSYPQMLGILSKNMFTIAISGTHGKTTTTAMVAQIMNDASLDPTVIVGSLLTSGKSNLIIGKSKYFVVEACEYRRSFLNLNPKVLIITNIDEDHLDYYKDINDIISAFRELALKIPKGGAIICDKRDPNIAPVIKGLECKIIDYTPYINKKIKLKVPGNHNYKNAGASSALADFLHINKNLTNKALEKFNGTWRRFEMRGKTKSGAIVYDDYAHHPNEIMATLSGMKELYPKQKRVAFFQPHLYSRTKSLLNEFSKSFKDAHEVYVLPIYAAREKFDSSINSEMLVDKIKNNGGKVFYVRDFNSAVKIINLFDKNTTIVNLGAGDIYTLSDSVISK